MGGVDKSDMMISLYRIRMKIKKWYRRLIFHMVDLGCSNAWHFRKTVKGVSSKYYKFKLAIAQCLTPQGVHSARHVPDMLLFLSGQANRLSGPTTWSCYANGMTSETCS